MKCHTASLCTQMCTSLKSEEFTMNSSDFTAQSTCAISYHFLPQFTLMCVLQLLLLSVVFAFFLPPNLSSSLIIIIRSCAVLDEASSIYYREKSQANIFLDFIGFSSSHSPTFPSSSTQFLFAFYYARENSPVGCVQWRKAENKSNNSHSALPVAAFQPSKISC